MISTSKQRGFTLIELIIVLAITAVLAAITIASFAPLNRRTDLNGNAQNIVSILNSARSKTVSSESASQWGAHFESDKYALFKGATYSASDPDTKIYTLPSSLEISTIALNGGGANAIFDRVTGKTSNYGQITIREISAPTNLININIENSGQSAIASAAQNPAGSRIADSRHIHFTYNGNAQTATTLLLEFPDYPSSNTSVPFQDYLNTAKDSFGWTQSVTVNGIARTIKIHTHSLTSSSATFSVHREREGSGEAMTLTLDGENLLNYTAGGQESKGTSAWVSEPTRQ